MMGMIGMKTPFVKAKPILDRLHEHGYEAFFVGGAVRDYILKQPIHDIDIATSATPDAVQAIFSHVIPVGIKHGTVVVVHEGQAYEVTTFRKESDYEDYRRPNEVEFISNLHEDLKRRDFTMNAIAMSRDLEIIDPFDGTKDIHNKLIRTVGSPYERFQEDPLRILRAVRFVSKLDFSIEKETLKAMDEMKKYIAHLSVERITQEFEKLLLGKANQKALKLIADYDIHLYLPGLKNCKCEIEQIAKLPLSSIKEAREGWALLLYFINEQPKPFLKEWKHSNKLIKDVETLLHALNKYKHKLWHPYLFYKLGWELSVSCVRIFSIMNEQAVEENIEKLKTIYENLPIKNRNELAVNGNDLISMSDRKRGPWMKNLITDIEKAIVSGKLANDKNEIRKWVLRWHKQSEKNY